MLLKFDFFEDEKKLLQNGKKHQLRRCKLLLHLRNDRPTIAAVCIVCTTSSARR